MKRLVDFQKKKKYLKKIKNKIITCLLQVLQCKTNGQKYFFRNYLFYLDSTFKLFFKTKKSRSLLASCAGHLKKRSLCVCTYLLSSNNLRRFFF